MDLPQDLTAHHISVLARNAYKAMLTEGDSVDRNELVLATLAQIAQRAGMLADSLERVPARPAIASAYADNVVPFTG